MASLAVLIVIKKGENFQNETEFHLILQKSQIAVIADFFTSSNLFFKLRRFSWKKYIDMKKIIINTRYLLCDLSLSLHLNFVLAFALLPFLRKSHDNA